MKQTDKKYWFKRHRFGYGLIPTTWQGVLCFVPLIAAIALEVYLIGGPFSKQTDAIHVTAGRPILFYGTVVITVAVFAWAISTKSPKPLRWRWGKKPTDNPDEDF